MGWGTHPNDLDIHLTIINECHVYYGNKACTGASLDVDNVSGGNYGPETITIKQYQTSRIYMLWVFDYSRHSYWRLHRSQARVAIKSQGHDEKLIYVPTQMSGTKWYWFIGCFRGNEGLHTMAIVNELRSSISTSLCNNLQRSADISTNSTIEGQQSTSCNICLSHLLLNISLLFYITK